MNQQSVKTPTYAWVSLIAIYLATLASPLNYFKVPPVMTTLIKEFSLNNSQVALVMSIFSIMGFILAIPAGFILKRFGVKLTGLISVGAVTIGSVLGAISSTTLILLFGRFIEGVGMGLIMVAAPFAISMWFPAQKRALPTGLWASCVGIGNVLIFFFAPYIISSYGWRAVWWAGGAFAAFAFIIFAILFRMPKEEEMYEAPPAPNPETQEEAAPSLIKGMANSNFWMICIAFGIYNLVVVAITYILPGFLETQRGYSLTYENGYLMNASFIAAFILLASVFTAPLGGHISDRIGKRKLVVLISYVLMTLTFLFAFNVTGSMLLLYVIVFGIVGGPIAPVLLASVPEVARKPQYIGIGMGVGALGQNVGMFIGPLYFGWFLDYYAKTSEINIAAYATAGYWLIPICLIGVIATCLIKVR